MTLDLTSDAHCSLRALSIANMGLYMVRCHHRPLHLFPLIDRCIAATTEHEVVRRCCRRRKVLVMVDQHLRGRYQVRARVPHRHRVRVILRSRNDVIVAYV